MASANDKVISSVGEAFLLIVTVNMRASCATTRIDAINS